MLRRDFLKSSVIGASAALMLPSLSLPKSGRRIGPDLPISLRQRAARLRRLDNILGGGDTFQLYHAEYESTQDILRQGVYTEIVGRDLLSVLSEQAQQAGWAAFDAGDQERAVQLFKASHSAAKEAGDAPLAGNALIFLAYQSIGSDPVSAMNMATASCETARAGLSGSVGALLHERRAWTHAVSGNATEAARALDLARAALANPPDAPQPDWSAWVDESELQIMTGRCWTELKRPLRAVPILQNVLSGFDDAYARDKALYLTWLAESYLAAGEVEESANVAGRVLDLSDGVASVRPRQQLANVLTRLAEYRNIPAVAHALEKARR